MRLNCYFCIKFLHWITKNRSVSECVVLRKFIISIIIILGIAYNVTRAHAKDVISPLWQKIEDARIYMNEGKLPDARIFFTQALDMAEKGKTGRQRRFVSAIWGPFMT